MPSIQVIDTIKEMQSLSQKLCRADKRIALVPTMGYLHEGHLSLMRLAKKKGDVTVFSSFVNPTQFLPNEDLDRYPRDFEGDLEKAEKIGVDLCFAPSAQEMYPPRFQTYVNVEEITKPLCGASRPSHFRGVTTVVMKLFHAVKPHVAVFGEKDFQQLQVIRRMVDDMNMDIEVAAGPIVREADGVAMSSRNAYLSFSERRQATSLIRALKTARQLFGRGERRALKLIPSAREVVEAEPDAKVDYIELRHPETLESLESVDKRGLMALAVFIGKTRLIDNMVLET